MTVNRIKRTIHTVLPLASTAVDNGKIIDWVDIRFGKNLVSIECHGNNIFGITIERFNSTPLGRADYFFDNAMEAIDVAIKLLCNNGE